MSKREASMFATQGVDVDAPRAKRHKPAETTTTSNGTREDKAEANGVKAETVEAAPEDPEAVKAKGLKVWQQIKDAVNKDGRILAVDFMRLPSKRQYPDYYQAIKRPIALDDIRRQIDEGGYNSLDHIIEDLVLCFKNAQKYNRSDSQIWKDAKHLKKLVQKESNKLSNSAGQDADDDGDGGSEGEDEDGKKKKGPSMTRLLKSRLQKLVDKTDEEGRVLSAEFMELPSKKQWPIYYKTIKKPQCLENIFKHLKRKEYHTSQQFASDVELVFANALEFNQEHTLIWEDAIVLRDYFRQLMSDLPPPYNLSPPGEHPTKLKLKMHIPAQAIQSAVSAPMLRIPPQASAAVTSSPTAYQQASSQAASSSVTPASVLSPTVMTGTSFSPATFPGTQSAIASQQQYSTGYTNHYPNAVYQSPSVTGNAPAGAAAVPDTNNVAHISSMSPGPPLPAQVVAPSKSPSPTSLESRRQLRQVILTILPTERSILLDYRQGVRTWALRLGSGERGVRISDVRHLSVNGEEVEESEEEEDENKMDVQEEEEEEDDPPAQEKPKRGRGRPRKKRGGKPSSESPKGKSKAVSPSKPTIKPLGEVQAVLNGIVVQAPAEQKGVWEIELPFGVNIVEVGEKGGMLWRAYLERVA